MVSAIMTAVGVVDIRLLRPAQMGATTDTHHAYRVGTVAAVRGLHVRQDTIVQIV